MTSYKHYEDLIFFLFYLFVCLFVFTYEHMTTINIHWVEFCLSGKLQNSRPENVTINKVASSKWGNFQFRVITFDAWHIKTDAKGRSIAQNHKLLAITKWACTRLAISIMFTHTLFFCVPSCISSAHWKICLSLSHDPCELGVLLYPRVSKAEVGHRQRSEVAVKQTRTRVGWGGGFVGRATAALAQIILAKLRRRVCVLSSHKELQGWLHVGLWSRCLFECGGQRDARGTRVRTHTSIQKQPWDIVRLRAASRKPNVFMSDKNLS